MFGGFWWVGRRAGFGGGFGYLLACVDFCGFGLLVVCWFRVFAMFGGLCYCLFVGVCEGCWSLLIALMVLGMVNSVDVCGSLVL